MAVPYYPLCTGLKPLVVHPVMYAMHWLNILPAAESRKIPYLSLLYTNRKDRLSH